MCNNENSIYGSEQQSSISPSPFQTLASRWKSDAGADIAPRSVTIGVMRYMNASEASMLVESEPTSEEPLEAVV